MINMISKSNVKTYFGFLLLAFFASYTTYFIFFTDNDYLEFYKIILEFNGNAPDQYRIIPYLLMKPIIHVFSLKLNFFTAFKLTIIIFNTIFLFMTFLLLSKLIKNIHTSILFVIFIGFSMFYPLAMFSGPRPVTAFYIFLISLYFFLFSKEKELTLPLVTVYILLAFSRPDLAMVVLISTIFYIHGKYHILKAILLFLLPIISHLLTSKIIFPNAVYYCKKIMLYDNISLNFIVHTPGTYLVVAVFLLFYQSIKQMVQLTISKYKYFYIAITLYLLVIFVVGRINELRLYLPFFPMVLYMLNKNKGNYSA